MLKTPPKMANACVPHADSAHTCSDYLLVCQARASALSQGTWHFSLETSEGNPVFDAGDVDFGDLNRLTLLAAVRGLEAIDGPSSVTLLSNNRYLVRSLSDSLPRWRETNFVWEHFGQRIDVQHADLWRRIARALSIHRVEACLISSRLVSTGTDINGQKQAGHRQSPSMRVDSPHPTDQRPHSAQAPKDQLRRWLLGDKTSDAAVASRRRFTALDLVEAS